jgi:hypothetical protein
MFGTAMHKGFKHSKKVREQISKSRKGKALREANPAWIGGKIKRIGYIMILNTKHPFSNKDGYIFEHRIVMEKKIGRYLKPKEVVHHINHKRTDNRPANLMLFASSGEHTKFHSTTSR